MSKNIIIGGGPAATNAVETIRQLDGKSEITLICDEPPHSRMALPYWLADQIPREHTYTGNDESLQKLKVDACIGQRVQKIDPQAKSVTLTDGSVLDFDNALIATGASPLDPPIPGKDLPGVQALWSLSDTDLALQTTAGMDKPRVVMVGAGFIGFIVLNAMFKRGWKLAVVEREKNVLPRMLDPGAATLVEDWLAGRGVAVHTNTTVQKISQADDGSKVVELAGGDSLPADLVILATGIQPNLDLVGDSGIQIDEGILVNDRMQTNFPFIYAGGDVAQGPVLFGDQPEIHAIQPTAVDHGRIAGANMCGQDVQYPGSLLMNVVDVCGLQTASFGNWSDASAEATTISHAGRHIYRKMLWQEDLMVGAIFAGQPTDMGMLTDVGMVKGILQTQTPMGPWKEFLRENPFDIRRAYIATGVAAKLAGSSLLGRPTKAREFHFGGAKPAAHVGKAHKVFVGTK